MPELPQETQGIQQMVDNKVLDLSSLRDDSDDLFEEKSRSKRARRFWIAGISLVLLAAIGAGVFFYTQQGNQPQVTYQYALVLRNNFTLSVNATGPVQADTYKADFSASGKISQIYVKLYAHVTKGQKLARLTKPDNSTVTLLAPHAGVVTNISNNVDDSLAGAVAGGFIQITDLSSLRIQAQVNEADIGKVTVGDTVQFTVSAYSTQTFGGKVTAVSPIGQTQSSVVTFPVIITVDMSTVQGVALLPNMTANVTITTVSRTNMLLISAKAVSFARQAPLQGILQFSQVTAALTQAQQLLNELKSANSSAAKDPLTAAYVLERSHNQWIVKPVVLSLTDGTFYIVVAGDLATGDNLVIGTQNGSNSSSNPQLPGGSGAPGLSGPGGLGG